MSIDLNLRAFKGIRPTLGERVYVDPAATVIGKVRVDDDASIWPGAVARGDVNSIAIGARTSVQDGCVLHVTHDGQFSPGGIPLIIGTDVTVGHRAVLHACTIGNGVLVGMGSILLDGVVVEDHCLIGAGSLVPPGKRLTSGGLYVGTPARRARDLTESEIAWLRYSAAHYVRLKDEYLNAR
jgi:carbonic anhydrase/acetyltransferase-like protein (isoleucine patch superfamily)